jgi:ornithine cyclodeaminase/alanine dehydrogenase-like protein (mu-crystallin family)
VALNWQKIVCDGWETVKHRAQTLSRMYKDGLLKDSDLHANLPELAAGLKPGRQAEAGKIYFNAVGLSYIDVALAYAMYKRSLAAGAGRPLVLQSAMLFEHQNLQSRLRL